MGKEAEKLPAGIRKRGGKYQWRFKYDGLNYSGSEDTKTAAVKAMRTARYEAETGSYIKESSQTVDEWFDQWIETIKRKTVKPNTLRNYQAIYKSQIKPAIGKQQIKNITTLRLQKMINSIAETGSGSMTNTVYVLLTGMFRDAYRLDLIKKDITDKITKPKKKKGRERKALTKEEQIYLLECLTGDPIENMVRLALQTGMRLGELQALSWKDIDPDQNVIQVQHTLLKLPGQPFSLEPTKSESGTRQIPLTEEANRILKIQKVQLLQDRLKAGQSWKPDPGMEDLVFTQKNGNPYTNVNRKTKLINKMLAKAGYDADFSFHVLRHTFGTRCYEAGMDLKALQEIMGHSSFNITMQIYVNADQKHKADQMKLVEKAL